jgi:hypothetical protein
LEKQTEKKVQPGTSQRKEENRHQDNEQNRLVREGAFNINGYSRPLEAPRVSWFHHLSVGFAETRARESRSIYFWPTCLVESSLCCRFTFEMCRNRLWRLYIKPHSFDKWRVLPLVSGYFGYRGISPAGSKELQ